MMPHDRTDFLINQSDLRSTTWQRVPSAPLRAGQARLRVDRFALTANNITYAVFGKKLRYWELFPAPDGYGRLPVWGFADVEETLAEGLAMGERIYGYFPMSSELVVDVADLQAATFSDAAPWRAPLAGVYNRYLRVTDDPAFATPSQEALQAVFRPLFTTSFLIADLFHGSDYFGAKSVVISSASSKTALALGYLLKQAQTGVEVIGLTSAGNAGFVEQTRLFDRVIDYAAIPALEKRPAAFVDMSGSAPVRVAVHGHFEEDLRYSCAVGLAHWEDAGRTAGLPGPKPVLFYAFDHIDTKIALWGVEGYERKLGKAWTPFSQAIAGLLQVSLHTGRNEVDRLYHAVLEGLLPPHEAAMASIRD